MGSGGVGWGLVGWDGRWMDFNITLLTKVFPLMQFSVARTKLIGIIIGVVKLKCLRTLLVYLRS